jgi:pimeloyl-ACP methyl ester carboxylesterase
VNSRHRRGAIRLVALCALYLCSQVCYSLEVAGSSECHSVGIGRDSTCSVNGTVLHYVDWGGRGTDVVLIAGFGNTARIFDELGPLLSQDHRVIAVTRRGFGMSGVTQSGYDADNLAKDVVELMTAIGVQKADIVGHSMAGEELTHMAVNYPERVRRLVYLDAAYDRSNLGALSAKDPVNRAPPKTALKSYESMTQWSQEVLKSHSPAIEADLRQTYASTPTGLKSKLSGSVTSAVISGVISDRPNYKTVRQPALALYSDWSHPDQLPPHLPKKVRDQAEAYYLDSVRPWQIAEEHRFTEEIKCGKRLEIKDSGHYFFLAKPSETAGYIDSFLASDTPCTWSRRD